MVEFTNFLSSGTIISLVMAVLLFLFGCLERFVFHRLKSELFSWLFSLFFLCAFIVGNEWVGVARWFLAVIVFVGGIYFLVMYSRDEMG